MRTSIGLRVAALVVGLLGASCLSKSSQSAIVVTAVSVPTFTAATATAPATCVCPTPPAGEVDFIRVGSGGLAPCLQVENRMPNNANGTVRLNTNDFQVDELHLTYENVGGPPVALPVGEVVVAANGIVPAAGKANFPAILVPVSIGTSLGANSAVRVRAYFKGKLLDQTTVKTSEYEYVVIGCGGSCPTNCMNSPQ